MARLGWMGIVEFGVMLGVISGVIHWIGGAGQAEYQKQ